MTVPQTIEAAALDYHGRGWKPVPISRRTKKPIGNGWQKRPFDPAQFNGNAQNIGVQFGAVSGGLVDVDLDSAIAIVLAPSSCQRPMPCSAAARSRAHTGSTSPSFIKPRSAPSSSTRSSREGSRIR